VLLLDAVDFSLHTPLEQVAMLNSLSYSVNSAYRQLISTDVQINFARTTTGDGFYIWNRASTIDLARFLDKALPGQILLGDFSIALRGADDRHLTTCDTFDFIGRTAAMLNDLEGLAVANDRIASIGCYLTGDRDADGSFAVRRYRIRDKHDLTRLVYNAKINIHLTGGAPIHLGYQHKDLHPSGGPELVWGEYL